MAYADLWIQSGYNQASKQLTHCLIDDHMCFESFNRLCQSCNHIFFKGDTAVGMACGGSFHQSVIGDVKRWMYDFWQEVVLIEAGL